MLIGKIYQLIKYYKKYKDKIIASAKKRCLGIDFQIIDETIEKIKQTNQEFNEVCAVKNKTEKDEKEKGQLLKLKKRNVVLKIRDETEKLFDALLGLPNILSDEFDNMEDEDISEQKDITVKEEDGRKGFITDFIDIDSFIKKRQLCTTEGRCIHLTKDLCIIRRKLINLISEYHQSNGLTEISSPFIVSERTLQISGHLPRFLDNLFKIEKEKFLIPTAEVSLIDFLEKQTEINNSLKDPVWLFAQSSCFRKEEAHAGKNNKRMIRQAQFEKIETFIIYNSAKQTKEQTNKILHNLLSHATGMLDILGLKYRIQLVCPKEMSTSSVLQYDVEVWMPGSQEYIEILSCSDCGSHQTYKMTDKDELGTMNCSCLPIDRLIVAIIENYYNKQTDQIDITF